MWKNLPSGQMMFFGLSASGWAAYSVQTTDDKHEIWPYDRTDGRSSTVQCSISVFVQRHKVFDVYNYIM